MPAWLNNPSAWIALGVSALFVVAAVAMHRVIKQVLQAPQPKDKQP
jgi:hypothetical protein